MKSASIKVEADDAAINRRLFVSGVLGLGTGLTARPSLADSVLPGATDTAVSEGGFRYILDPASPFSVGVAALPGHGLIRVRLRDPLPFEQGQDLVARYLADAGRQPSALAGLELRSPAVMSRPEFQTFNRRYVSALRARGFVTGQVVPVARSNMVPLYDPPKTDVLSAFTYAAPSDARTATGPDVLLSGRPEYDGSHVIAPWRRFTRRNEPQGGFRHGAPPSGRGGLRRAVVGSDRCADIYERTAATGHGCDARRGFNRYRAVVFPGSTPVVGFDGVQYAFEADVRAIGLERVI